MFSVLAIAVIAVALVLIPKDDEQKSDKDNAPSEEIYATSFSLNLPNTIIIPVGSSVNLLDCYVNVSPSSMIDKLTYEISSNGIEFSNNKIIANTIGLHTIKFKMPKDKSTFHAKTITINVCDASENPHVLLIKNLIINGKSEQINNVFSISDGVVYKILTDNNVNLNNNSLTGINVGDAEITFNIEDDFIEYVYKFTLKIKEQPEYSIILNNVDNNLIVLNTNDNDVFHINYQVVDKNEQHVEQQISVVSYNTDVVKIESVADDILIKIRAKSIGETKIKISILSNSTIFVEINVLVN